jgi:hypothetical protein
MTLFFYRFFENEETSIGYVDAYLPSDLKENEPAWWRLLYSGNPDPNTNPTPITLTPTLTIILTLTLIVTLTIPLTLTSILYLTLTITITLIQMMTRKTCMRRMFGSV